MAVIPRFTTDDIKRRLDAFLDEVQRQQIRRLQMLGEMCVQHAREVPSDIGFSDRTGNLRSSIGYSIFVDGVAVHSSYEVVKDGVEGAKAGQDLATRVGNQTSGVCLVVTAGMNYALHVESQGRDVITSAEELAREELPRLMNRLADNIRREGE